MEALLDSEAKKAITVAKAHQKEYADKRRSQSWNFQPKDKVLLNTQNFTFPDDEGKKLRPKWIGPFDVLEKIGRCSYKIGLPPEPRLHPVFHENLLKFWIPDSNRPVEPKPFKVEGEEEWEVEQILAHKPVTADQNQGKLRYLVKFVGYGPHRNLWLSREQLVHSPESIAQYWLNPNRGSRGKRKRS